MEQLPNINPQENILLKPKKRWYKRWWGILLIIFGLYFLTTFILLFSAKNNLPSSGSLNSGTSVKADEQKLYLNAASNPTFGNKNAKVTMVEFADFQCPYCRQSFFTVRELLQTYGDKIYFIYRDFPVSELHAEAFKAAVAGRCAAEQGKFWPMHDKMFINQSNLKEADLKSYAASIGLAVEQFGNCLASDKYDYKITQDYLDGIDLGVKGTPTFFIQGYPVSGVIPKDIFIKIIDSALAE